MWKRCAVFVCGTSLAIAGPNIVGQAVAQHGKSPVGESRVYKTVDGRDLHLFLSEPKDWDTGPLKAAVVFFHGGGWVDGGPQSFNTQAETVALHGAVAITVEYRLIQKNSTTMPEICVQDTKSAIRWVRSHAKELHIDPNKIAGSGGSAGGYDVAYAAVAPGWDDPQDDLRISPKPNALVLFNPVIDTSVNGYGNQRFQGEAEKRSPMTYASKNWPPTLVMSGSEDALIHANVLTAFAEKMKELDVPFDLKIYPGRSHGFYNKEPDRSDSAREMIHWLSAMGYVKDAVLMPVNYTK